MENSSAKSFIKEKAESFNSGISDLESKRKLAWKLHDTYEDGNYIERLDDDIEFLEGPELEELENMLGPEKIYSIWSTIGISLACLLPSGDQIESVKTGFEEKEGDFYYKIKVDGEESSFSTPTVNSSIEIYENETYLEIEDLDQKLMKLGIKKESSEKNSQKSRLDQQYIDRFLRIINNSPNS